jgi:hypothetical protein
VNPVELLDALLESLVPPTKPPDGATPEQMDQFHRRQQRYRRRVSIVACSSFIGLMLFASWALGAIPGFKGFAMATQVERYETMQIDKYMTDYLKDQCLAPLAVKPFYEDKIKWLKSAWLELHPGQPYEPPACTKLGVLEITQ